MRDACARHLRDLDDGPKRGLRWDVNEANEAIAFFREVLVLNGGEFEGVPFELLLWQKFIVGSIYGWKRADGTRRFRLAYVETGKGSGKSPIAAGIGMKGLVADNEERAEIYAAATKKDQAQVLFRDAIAMYKQSPELYSRLEPSGGVGKEWNLAHHASNSFFRPIASDDGGQSGPRPHIILGDEVHEMPTRTLLEMLRAGFKFRRQPLMFLITNSGAGKQCVAWEYHEYGAKVCAGLVKDDSLFAYICALDEGEDPFVDEACWPKANPSLGTTIRPDYLREQVTEARGMPAKEATVRRLNFCQWVEAHNPWISGHVWLGAGEEIDQQLLLNRRCWGGLDLSSTQDLTAFVLVFEPTEDDPVWRMLQFFWLPEDTLSEKADKDRVPYIAWRTAGHLETTPGRAISKLHVLHRISEICAMYDAQEIGYDRWRIEDLKMLMEQEGISLPPLNPFGQGFKDMAPALDEFERRLVNGQLKHNNNPVMTWCAANAVVSSDPAGNRKVAKDKATGRVDGIVAAVMATGLTIRKVEQPITDIFVVL